MARKSRKTKGEEKAGQTAGIYRAAFYLRLSEKDQEREISQSIENQRELLTDFLKEKPDLEWAATFIDDGKTGTNFSRNGFEQMMEEVKAGNINCIIVKDLSRFGRNYLEAGNYIEHVLPFLNVRFIAVTDHFDSLTATASELAYLIPLKNVMNENYARDISKKVRSSKKVLRQKGFFLGSYAVYGYEKSEDKHILRIDPEAARHVQEIFDMCENGYSDSAITRYLNAKEIPCPARYKYEKGILHDEKYKQALGWYPQTVAAILKNRVYIGDMIQGKRKSQEIKGKKKAVSEENWDVVANTHEPIISQEQFSRVQKIRSDRHEKYLDMVKKASEEQPKEKEPSLVKGKIFCGECKKAMQRKHIKNCRDSYRYLCDGHERRGLCSLKYVRESDLLETLETLIKKRIELACDIKSVLEKQSTSRERKLQNWEQQRSKIEKELSAQAKRKAMLYQDWKEGILDQDEYLYMKERYEKDMLYKEEQKRALLKEQQEYMRTCTAENPAIHTALQYPADVPLTKEMMDSFIDRVEIYDSNRICVTFLFQDEIEEMPVYQALIHRTKEEEQNES